MTADRNLALATQTGEADVYRSAMPESAPSIVINDAELQLITPELGHQVQIQTEILKDWLRFRAKNHILVSIFNQGEDLDDEVDDDGLIRSVYKPELQAQQVQHFGAAMSIVKEQLPQLEGRLERAESAYDIAKGEREAADLSLASNNPRPYYLMNEADIKQRERNRKKDVRDLNSDIVNAKLVGKTHESMLLHIQGLARDIDTDALRAEFKTLSHEARILAYTEAIAIVDDKIRLEEHDNYREVLERQKEALMLELSFYSDKEPEVKAAEVPAPIEQQEVTTLQLERRKTIFSALSAHGIRLFQTLNFK